MKINWKRVIITSLVVTIIPIFTFMLMVLAGAVIEERCLAKANQIVGDQGDLMLVPNLDEPGSYGNGYEITWRLREILKCERAENKIVFIYGGIFLLSALLISFMWKKNKKHRTPK